MEYSSPTDSATLSRGTDSVEPESKLDASIPTQTATPPPSTSGDSSPVPPDEDGQDESEQLSVVSKKKKKKKPKKLTKAKAVHAHSEPTVATRQENATPVLCISRNKHWKYISSYHGPWLQLPIELLESLLILNMDPATLQPVESLKQRGHSSAASGKAPARVVLGSPPSSKSRTGDFSLLQDPHPRTHMSDPFQTDLPHLHPPLFTPQPGKPTPPPIDPGVFRSLVSIRRLIDEAADLSVRASSGLSAAALGAMRGAGGGSGSMANSLFGEPMNNGGRNVAMSPMRIHRLRVMAVQKLATAYQYDEVASSVMIMQGGSVFDDIAERVLKVDPNDIDARYVHFFHEKIPTRQLAEYTTTCVLDELIAAQPQRLEFYRTRGIVHCFRDEFTHAVKDFTYALKESRAVRKARQAHSSESDHRESRSFKGNKKKKRGSERGYVGRGPSGHTTPNGTGTTSPGEGLDAEPLLLHPSVLPDAPDPIEPQLLFLRASTFMQHAMFLVEEAILRLEGIPKGSLADGAELRLCFIDNGRYGGVEIGNPAGPLGSLAEPKACAYMETLGNPVFRDTVSALLRKSVRDHERFLSHFDTLEGPIADQPVEDADNIVKQVEVAFLLTDALRTGDHTSIPQHLPFPMTFTTYHPLVFEAHYSILICMLMLGDFVPLLPAFTRTAAVVDGLEGYPVFLPPRSMAQAEFIEVLERLASGWRVGALPHFLIRPRALDTPSRVPVAATPSTKFYNMPSEEAASTLPSPGPSRSSTMHSLDDSLGSATDEERRNHLIMSLDSLRILLAPAAKRQQEHSSQSKHSTAADGKRMISIPLHGPRVEIILAWLASTHLPELELLA